MISESALHRRIEIGQLELPLLAQKRHQDRVWNFREVKLDETGLLDIKQNLPRPLLDSRPSLVC